MEARPTPQLVAPHVRGNAFTEVGSSTFDLFVIGGGITGAGLASAAARVGLKVGLCETADFAVGTSSRSSKLIHGGLRYLESFELGLVRSSARERKEIHEKAPHLAEPRWMLAPYRGLWQKVGLKLGISLYEWLGGVNHADRQQDWSDDVLLERAPGLDRESFPQAIAYREYTTDDARLVLALLRDARSRGAWVMNYAGCESMEIQSGEAIEVRVRDHVKDAVHRIKAHTVVNAAGPWVDEVMTQGVGRHESLIQLSRGVHIVLSANTLPVHDLLMLRAVDERRFFVMRRGEVVHVGTTDILQPSPAPQWPQVTVQEVEYLLDSLRKNFPQLEFEKTDIIGAWAGLRPLVCRPERKAESPGKISRAEEVVDHGDGFLTIAGGKLTGYPGMARKILEKVALHLRRNEYALTRISPAPLPGGDFEQSLEELQEALRGEYPALSPNLAHRLVRYYGSEAFSVLKFGCDPIEGCPEILHSELYWAFEIEGAVSLQDVIYRRIRLFYYSAIASEQSEGRIQAIARACAHLQGWSASRLKFELDSVMEAYRSETSAYLPEPKKPKAEVPVSTAPFASLLRRS